MAKSSKKGYCSARCRRKRIVKLAAHENEVVRGPVLLRLHRGQFNCSAEVEIDIMAQYQMRVIRGDVRIPSNFVTLSMQSLNQGNISREVKVVGQ